MSDPIVVNIVGIPRPGGSKTATLIRRKGGDIVMKNGRPLITTRDDAKGNAEWKSLVAYSARQEYHGSPLAGSLAVRFEFFVTRPKDHFGSKGQVRRSAPKFPAKKPDGLKLCRSTEDACSGILWVDDALIVRHNISKDFAERPGCRITITVLDDSPAASAQAPALPLFEDPEVTTFMEKEHV